ncbi:MAG TPA: nucleotide pyrophosphatase/phosphodiesterase family protein [Isosphaeraceae bacterium]|nr:nucleotide pyrophosphatase/phosphodiesterase family protein [Isosphaeraceae bacterium]
MPSPPAPLVVINAVGLTGRLLPLASRLTSLVNKGWQRPLREVIPAVTCPAQATILTGRLPREHGIVANGWLFRETGEVRFWQQSNALIQAEPLYVQARRLAAERGWPFRAAKLFWWFNQGADVDISVTPKPYYGADGNKAFGISGTPEGLTQRLEAELGPFPFHTFWGPAAGLGCSRWIAASAAQILDRERPSLTFVYLPHVDYDPQRFGPSGSDMPRLLRELDEACAPLLEAAAKVGARVWVLSEYGHCDVTRPVLLNRVLRKQGLLTARPGPFGEVLEPFSSRALAVCDHQVAHVYVRTRADRPLVRDLIAKEPGVDRVVEADELRELGLDHPRSGELVALSKPDSWFAYPFWEDDALAPDYARTVDIHRKPGYDPCELLLDPALRLPKLRIALRLAQKKLGFRTLFDVIPLDPSLIKGSHGVPASRDEDRPILIADGPDPPISGPLALTAVHDLLLRALVPE